MPTLEKLREIASKRTKGKWLNDTAIPPESNWRLSIGNSHWAMNTNDAEFIAMAANNMDKLLAVVEAAKGLCDHNGGFIGGLVKAVKDLDGEK